MVFEGIGEFIDVVGVEVCEYDCVEYVDV